MPLKEIVFRLLLKNSNKATSLQSLHWDVTEEWAAPDASDEHNRGGYEANPGLRQLLLLQGVDEQGKGAVEEEGRTQVRVRDVPPPMAELGRTTRQDGKTRRQTRSLRV